MSDRTHLLNVVLLFLLFPAFLPVLGCATATESLPAEAQEGTPPEAYVIGPEDVLEISVWQNEELSRTVTVRPDGKISMPLINEVQAAGLTTEALKEEIRRSLKPYMDAPDVAVIVQEINSWKIYIQGEVRSPGVYPLRSHTSLSQAISMAGGFTEFAKKGKIQIIRKREGATEVFRVNYKKILSGASMRDDVLLRPGDTIVVP